MSAGDTARHAYDAARQEILLRMRQRDQVLLVYLMVIATIFGISFGSTESNKEILLIVPFIALGVSIIVSQHNVVMAHLGQFCAEELVEFLKELDPPEYAPNWDDSKTYKEFSRASTDLRFVCNLLIVCVPCLMSLWSTKAHAVASAFPYGQLWWFDLLLSISTMAIIWKSRGSRHDIFKARHWRQ